MSKSFCTLLSSLVIVTALGCSSSENQKSASAARAPVGSLESAIVVDGGVDAGDAGADADAAP